MTMRIVSLLLTPGLSLGLIGCQQQLRSEAPITNSSRDPAATSRTSIVGYSVEGRPIECVTLGSGPRTTLVIASIHGDEPAGTPLAHRLIDELQSNPAVLSGRCAVVMPIANPDGYAAGTRLNTRQVDLNRNFATDNRTSHLTHGPHGGSEPETRAIIAVIDDCSPDRIVSIHQPLACVDYDGPAGDLAESMAAQTSLPVRRLGARPGSLGSFAGVMLGIPTITLELPGSAHRLDSEGLWRRYGRALLAAITYDEADHQTR